MSPATVRRWESLGWLVPTRRLPGSQYRRYSRQSVDEFRVRYNSGELDAKAEERNERLREYGALKKQEAAQKQPAPPVEEARAVIMGQLERSEISQERADVLLKALGDPPLGLADEV